MLALACDAELVDEVVIQESVHDDGLDDIELARDLERRDDCAGEQDAPAVEASWRGLQAGADLTVSPDSPSVPVVVRNIYDRALDVEVRMTLHTGEGVTRRVVRRVDLDVGGERAVSIPLPRDLDTSEHPAQLLLTLRPIDGDHTMSDVLLPPLFFHEERGQMFVYDEEGMTARHRGGDLRAEARLSTTERRHFVAAGRARLARPEDLVGDPTDLGSNAASVERGGH